MRSMTVVLAARLALASGCMAEAQDSSREDLVCGYTTVLKTWDRDRDGRLNQLEVAAMVNEFFQRVAKTSPEGKMTDDLEKQRQMFLSFYASQDTDKDGYLTIEEFLKLPLASFDCLDEDHDGKISRDDAFKGINRCPSARLDDYAPKP